MALKQSGGTVSGTFEMLDGFCGAPAGFGTTDPAEPGTIDVDGNVQIRFKAGKFVDFYFRGVMKAPGRQIVGGVFQSGFAGEATTLDRIL
jgi:hypothetical protein